MRRRDLVLVAGTAFVSSRMAHAQQDERVRRIGYFTGVTGSPDDVFGVQQTRALVEELRELGWPGLVWSRYRRAAARGRAVCR
jgi:hypothetical protein